MDYTYLENKVFSHEHSIEDPIQINATQHMNNEHYLFQESAKKTDNDFYQKFNNLLNN